MTSVACHQRSGASALLLAAGWLILAGTASAQTVRVVEYQHDAWTTVVVNNTPSYPQVQFHFTDWLGIQFLTAHDGDIRALDAGWLHGWRRTMLEFTVWNTPGEGRVPVCRFYGPRVGSSARHFYTAFADECTWLRSSSDWVYEGPAFYAPLPDTNGECGPGLAPIFRSYRQRKPFVPGSSTPIPGEHTFAPRVNDGPQHRFATTPAYEADDGFGTWQPEGVAFCVKSFPGDPDERLRAFYGEWEIRFDPPHPTFDSLSLQVGDIDDFGTVVAGAMVGRWGAFYIYGDVLWRAVDDKTVVSVHPSNMNLYLDYQGGSTVRGSAYARVDCHMYIHPCVDTTARYTVIGTKLEKDVTRTPARVR